MMQFSIQVASSMCLIDRWNEANQDSLSESPLSELLGHEPNIQQVSRNAEVTMK